MVISKTKFRKKTLIFLPLKKREGSGRIRTLEVRIRGSGSVPKRYGSGTLVSSGGPFKKKFPCSFITNAVQNSLYYLILTTK
jgi:hypothetical protein